MVLATVLEIRSATMLATVLEIGSVTGSAMVLATGSEIGLATALARVLVSSSCPALGIGSGYAWGSGLGLVSGLVQAICRLRRLALLRCFLLRRGAGFGGDSVVATVTSSDSGMLKHPRQEVLGCCRGREPAPVTMFEHKLYRRG